MKKVTCVAGILCLALFVRGQDIASFKSYKPVNEYWVDSILSSVSSIAIGSQFNGSNADEKYHFFNGNINEATAQKIVFTAKCCGPDGLYSGRVELIDTLNKIIYSLTNSNIAGIDHETGVGNDVSAIEVVINGHSYRLPIVLYNKGKQFSIKEDLLYKNNQTVNLAGRLVLRMRGKNVIPLLLIDDIILINSNSSTGNQR